MNSILIRNWKREDVTKIAKMHANAFIDAWNEEQYLSSFNADGFIGGLIEVDGQIACTVAFSSILGEAELLSVVTDTPFRGQGFAEKLLTTYFDKLILADVNEVFLEVREGNTPARKLYEKLGFNKISIRKKYYGEESAVIYKRSLK